MKIEGVPENEPMVQIPLCVALSSVAYHRVGCIKSLAQAKDQGEEEQKVAAQACEIEHRIADAVEACIREATGKAPMDCEFTDWIPVPGQVPALGRQRERGR